MLISRKLSDNRSWIEQGLMLADIPVEEGGWKEYFDGEVDEALSIKDDLRRAGTALMLENAKRWIGSMVKGKSDGKGNVMIDETTRSAVMGGFTDHLFPVIRAAMPSNPLNDIVSVQPTSRRIATITYFNWVYGSTKGNIAKGQKLFDANTGKPDNGRNYSGAFIEAEPISVSAGSSMTATLKWVSGGGVRPGTVRLDLPISGDTLIVSDNGRGGLTAVKDSDGSAVTLSTGTINYITGGIAITSASAFVSGTGVANYGWNSEGGDLPEVDVSITTNSVETQRRGLRMNNTAEAAFDLQQEYGTQLDQALIKGAAELLNFEQFQQVLREIWSVTPVTSTWDKTPGTQLSRVQHFEGLLYNINEASNSIWKRTQKAVANWAIADSAACNVLETLPSTVFQRAAAPSSMMGAYLLGTLNGTIKVYKYLHLDKEPGSAAAGNLLLGYKGNEFWEAGAVWSPYQLLYTTDPLTTANFVTQRGIATRYATKLVNPAMFARINFTGSL